MRSLLKRVRNQRGFTLIELLVVVAILGVLAAVLIPNVSRFIGTGQVEAANTEAHSVLTAVTAYMADNNLATASGTISRTQDIGPAITGGTTVKSFLVAPEGLQATYTITDGVITAAVAESDGKWAKLTYSLGQGWQKQATPTP